MAVSSSRVQEIENAIAALSDDDMRELYAWLEHNRPHPLDLLIDADFASGRLDSVIQEALENGRIGRLRPL